MKRLQETFTTRLVKLLPNSRTPVIRARFRVARVVEPRFSLRTLD